MGTQAIRCAVPALLIRRRRRRWTALLACTLACPAVLAQVDTGLQAVAVAQTHESLQAGTGEASALPRIDLALLAPTASPPRDPLRMVQENQGVRGPKQLNLALRWRQQVPSGHAVDASIWRSITVDSQRSEAGAEPLYGAQVEMELRSGRKAALRDLLGMKLDNGGRISLRPRKGKVAIYYRVQF